MLRHLRGGKMSAKPFKFLNEHEATCHPLYLFNTESSWSSNTRNVTEVNNQLLKSSCLFLLRGRKTITFKQNLQCKWARIHDFKLCLGWILIGKYKQWICQNCDVAKILLKMISRFTFYPGHSIECYSIVFFLIQQRYQTKLFEKESKEAQKVPLFYNPILRFYIRDFDSNLGILL